MSGTASGTHLKPGERLLSYGLSVVGVPLSLSMVDFGRDSLQATALCTVALVLIFTAILTLWDARREAASKQRRRQPSFYSGGWDPNPGDRLL